MIRLLILFSILGSFNFVKAAFIEDIEVLDIVYLKDKSIELKVRSSYSSKDSFFFLVLRPGTKTTEDLTLIMLKVVKKNMYKLDVDIPSFSPYPSGSYYNTQHVKFFGSHAREPNNVIRPKKSKKTRSKNIKKSNQ